MRERLTHRNLFCLSILFSALSLVLNSGNVMAQDDIDSLKKVVIAQNDDKEKADNLLEIGLQYYRKLMVDSAMKYFDESYILSEKLKYDKGMAEAEYKNSLLYARVGDYNEASERVLRFIRLSESIGDSSMIAKGYYHYGNVVSEFGEVDTSIRCYKESLRYYLGMNNSFGIMATYNALGNIFKDISRFDSAAYYYLEAARIAESTGAENQLSTIWYNVGIAYSAMEDYENAKIYVLKSLEINEKLGHIEGLANNYVHLGNTAIIEEDLDQALFYLKKADSLKTILGDRHGLANIYNGYGEIYEKKGQYARAVASYKEAMKFYREQEHALGMIISLKNIADIYSLQNSFSTARVYYDSALQIAVSSGYRTEEKNIFLDISTNYYRSGDYRSAYDYFETYKEVSDSIFNLERAEKIAELELKYEKEKDQAEILRLANDNLVKENALQLKQSQQKITIYVGISLLIIILLIALYIRQKAVKDRAIAEQRIKRLEEEKKVLAAKALVEGQENERKRIAQELHDSLGALLSTTKMQFTTIKDKSPENKPLIERASKLLEQASSDVRRISHNMMPGLLTKLGLYDALEDLFDGLKESGELKVETIIPETEERLNENKEIMIYRIVQEMVNNTIKHSKAKNISFQLRLIDEQLLLQFADDGIGFNVEEQLEKKSLGLTGIQSRINFLNGTMSLESGSGKGTRYLLEIPI